MRASTAYFAGAGTVVAAIVAGLGGGLLIANIVSPTTPKQGTETTHLERRMSPEPIQAVAGSSEPVPYLAAPQLSALAAPQLSAPGAAVTGTAPPADTATAAAPAAPAAPPATSPAPASNSSAQEQRSVASEDAFAKAREADVRRDAEAKRAADKRKAERRQQWADKRRYQQRQAQELRDVEDKVREETDPRRERVFAAEPVKIEMPQIRLFGPE
jgi:hypothetical protein